MRNRFKKILIANRGEIALRIIRAAKAEGIRVAAIYTDEEKQSAHVLHADEAYSMGSGQLADTYLNVSVIVKIALNCGAEAIHPGYGFLSENPELANECEKAGIVFIGPSAKALSLIGNKITAKQAARQAGIQVLDSISAGPDLILQNGVELAFPLMIKACHGGGGKGMQVVNSHPELILKLEQSSRAAANFFGNNEIFLEPYIAHARHVEVQLMADKNGNIVHLYDRDCTLQRNHQKIIEEAPAAFLSNHIRQSIWSAAIKLGQTIGYENAGTVEFLVEPSGKFYFMEMNPRIQVEHTVTEAVTGIDLVREQLSVAAGNPLSFFQNEIRLTGHAIQARIYTEDPFNGFRPSSWEWCYYHLPDSHNVRVETELLANVVPANRYEPLAAKVIVHAASREQAISQLQKELHNTVLLGPETNLSYLNGIIKSKYYLANTTNTRFLEDHHEELKNLVADEHNKIDYRFIIAAFVLFHNQSTSDSNKRVWGELPRWRMFPWYDVRIGPLNYSFFYRFSNNKLTVESGQIDFEAQFEKLSANQFVVTIENQQEQISVAVKHNAGTLVHAFGQVSMVKCVQFESHYPAWTQGFASQQKQHGDIVASPLHGKIVKIAAQHQQAVEANDLLVVIEAMKSENRVLAPKKGRVEKIFCKVGDQVADGMPLLIIEDQ